MRIGQRPPQLVARLTYRRLFESHAFAERNLISERDLAKAADSRGIRLSTKRADLEELDRDGALQPVAFRRGQGISWRLAASPPADQLLFREEQPFRAWDEHAEAVDGVADVTALYSPWHVLLLPSVADGRHVPISAIDLQGSDEEVLALRDAWQPAINFALPAWKSLGESWDPFLKVLARITNRYWPYVSGRTVQLIDPETKEYVSAVDVERKRATPPQLLEECDLTEDQLEQLYTWAARTAAAHDPAREWYPLLRAGRRDRYEQLRGDLCVAGDFYDAAVMLRRFYRDVTGELLPDCDQVDGMREGQEARPLRLTSGDLILCLGRVGLYPNRLHLLVEGPTEVALIPELYLRITGREMAADGIGISALRGTGNIVHARPMLEQVRQYARAVAILVDAEGPVQEHVSSWVKTGVIEERLVHVWPTSLEEENFTNEELIDLARRIADLHDVELKLTAEELQRRYASEQEAARRDRRNAVGLATLLLKLAREERYGPVRVDKSQLVESMADLIVDDVRQHGWDGVLQRRPVLGWMQRFPLRAS